MDLSIIPECYVDTNLMETIVLPREKNNHQKGCGTVAKVMKEKFTDSFALGIIDEDKNELDYLGEFTAVCTKGSLTLHKHQTKHHYIIQISPAIEQFILLAVAYAKLDLADYDLPNTLQTLSKVTKSTNSKDDERFKRLFRDLKKSEATELGLVSAWLTYLKENRYNIDLDIVREL